MARLRVVVFDDDLELALRGVEIPGVELRLEGSAEDAERVVEEFRPDLVFMDHNFGRFVRLGDAAIRELRARWKAEQLMIIGISSSEVGNRALLEAGANTCMPKREVVGYLQAMAAATPGEGQNR